MQRSPLFIMSLSGIQSLATSFSHARIAKDLFGVLVSDDVGKFSDHRTSVLDGITSAK